MMLEMVSGRSEMVSGTSEMVSTLFWEDHLDQLHRQLPTDKEIIMKKSTLVVSTLLCIGIARAAALTYTQAINQSKQNVQAKDYVAAEKGAQDSLALAKSPEDTANAFLLLGETFYRRKMYEEARVQWRKAAALPDPKHQGFQAFAHLNLARSYKAEGNADKAIAEYQVLLAILNSLPDTDQEAKREYETFVSLLIADAHLAAKQYEPARELFIQVFEADQDLASIALFKVAQIDFVQNRFKQALAEFNQVLNMEGANPDVKAQAQAQITALTPLLPLAENAEFIKSGGKVVVTITDDTIDVIVDKAVGKAY